MAGAFIVSSGDFVDRALAGFAMAHSDVVQLHDDPVYLRSRDRNPRRRVGLVSGGGSGHEPMHIGFVGRGMLDAAVPGKVFASPHNRQIYHASKAVAGGDGVLHIVKNYTGDRINFAIAAERLAQDGIAVQRVLVDDDIATDSDLTGTGRRGTGATIIVEKLLGAAADEGAGLVELANLGRGIAGRSRSVAVASAAQTSLATGLPAFNVPDDRLEYGVGIHGERASRTVNRPPLEDLVDRMVTELLDACASASQVLILVNGLGGSTSIELCNVYAEVIDRLQDHSVGVAGGMVGTYSPALDMRGFSVTITAIQPEWQRFWDAPAWTSALRK